MEAASTRVSTVAQRKSKQRSCSARWVLLKSYVRRSMQKRRDRHTLEGGNEHSEAIKNSNDENFTTLPRFNIIIWKNINNSLFILSVRCCVSYEVESVTNSIKMKCDFNCVREWSKELDHWWVEKAERERSERMSWVRMRSWLRLCHTHELAFN